MKILIKNIIISYTFSQLISILGLGQIMLSEGAFKGIWEVLFTSLPTNVLFVYIIIQIYQIVFKNIDILKYASIKIVLLFYGDYLPKLGICIFSALCHCNVVKTEQEMAYIIFGILIVIDIFLEIMVVTEFYKLEKEEMEKKKDNTIIVTPLKCTEEEYRELNNTLLYSLVGCCFPYGYIFLYNNMEYVFLYCEMCIAVHYGIYKTFNRRKKFFQFPKYIFRTFCMELVAHIFMFFACISEQEMTARGYILAMIIVMNLYWFFRIVYQLAKTSRRMELYLKKNKTSE